MKQEEAAEQVVNPVSPLMNRLALLSLALAPAAIGMTEELPIGLLPDIAHDLNVPLSGAGMLVSGYALGVVIGAPLLALGTRRLPRKPLLLGALLLYVIGNALHLVMPDYPALLLVRFLTALVHGIIFGESYVFAAQLAPQRQAQAIALVFGGFVVATVGGVPLGTWLGQQFGWRMPFLVVTGLGILSVLAIALLLPATKLQPQRVPLGQLFRGRVLLPLAMTVTSCGGIFALLTYVVPLLEQVSGFAPAIVSVLLLIFGVGSFCGNLLGGRLADRWLYPSLLGWQMLQLLLLTLFLFLGSSQVIAVGALFVWQCAGFATIAPIQSIVIKQAGEASSLASAFNVAASNLGNAAAAFLGGLALTRGVQAVPLVSLIFVVLGLALTLWCTRLVRSE
ncbi:DHA1 family inner membrane transport protein [Thermosporothrix hazakensis]|jgi:DHA1 family inner membrane transport protein|uniref:DHA1 family inner membrane transport protein n=1 Tax=Thermosporothrix hazakensis TaxID=644383 RepID=A0A326U5B8_THEHA|nr:MFS transporter [Thermosporothrix hazakensis]PZW28498.1 DHA1 family inner membrane transport protein [Thermosporothrix hazakensis]GCE45272.1 MFS transporter [Thermosporothrix hazakensis]